MGRVDGEAAALLLERDGVAVADQWFAWSDVDLLVEGRHALTLHIASGLDPATEPVSVTHLGPQFDECAETARELRSAARRACMAQTPREPMATFVGRAETAMVDVHVLSHALSVEPRGGAARLLPWGLVEAVQRSGYVFEVCLRGGLGTVDVGGFGARTDEFEQAIVRVRSECDAAVGAAISDAGAAGVRLPDGWATAEPSQSLVASWSSKARSAEVSLLVDLAEEVRWGMWTEGGAEALPFVLARRGTRVAVEAVDADDRATFVFESGSVDRLNAHLILASFRREVLSADVADLGRWATAVRTSSMTRDLRGSLIARVVHTDGWDRAVRDSLGVGAPSP